MYAEQEISASVFTIVQSHKSTSNQTQQGFTFALDQKIEIKTLLFSLIVQLGTVEAKTYYKELTSSNTNKVKFLFSML